MRTRRRLGFLAAAAPCLTIACSDPAGVDAGIAEIAGRYDLVAIDGQPIPKVVKSRWVLELSMTLTEDRRLVLRGWDFPTATSPPGPVPPPTFRQDVYVTAKFTRHDTALAIQADAPSTYLEQGSAVLLGPDSVRLDTDIGTPANPIVVRYLYVK